MARNDERIEAQQKYVTGSMTIRELAEEMGLNPSTLARWSKENGWPELRRTFEQRAMQKAITKASSKRADKLARLLEASGTLEDALILATRQFKQALQAHEDMGKSHQMADGFRAKNMQSLAAAIQTATETRFTLDSILTEAERQKLQLEKRKLKREERQDLQKQQGQAVEYTLSPELEEMAD